MKIFCKKKEGRAGTLTIYVDQEIWRDIHSTIFGRTPTFPANCQTMADLEEWLLTAEYRGAFQYALKRLTLKSQPTIELQKSLETRLVSELNIQKVIAKCKEFGYLNDDDWLASFVRIQMSRKLGPYSIIMKLRAKGIHPEIAKELVEHMDNSEGQQERIAQLLATRYRNRDLSDNRIKQKVIASLIRKGFAYEEINKFLRHGN